MIELKTLSIPTIIVPSSQDDDPNPNISTWKDGKLIRLELGKNKAQLYIGHTSEEIANIIMNEDGSESLSASESETITRAFAFDVEKPVTRARAINAAEAEAYGLKSISEQASFNASLARKSRNNEDVSEVEDHDNFIDWVKEELGNIGID